MALRGIGTVQRWPGTLNSVHEPPQSSRLRSNVHRATRGAKNAKMALFVSISVHGEVSAPRSSKFQGPEGIHTLPISPKEGPEHTPRMGALRKA